MHKNQLSITKSAMKLSMNIVREIIGTMKYVEVRFDRQKNLLKLTATSDYLVGYRYFASRGLISTKVNNAFIENVGIYPVININKKERSVEIDLNKRIK